MNNTRTATQTEPSVVARRTAFDGVVIFLHEDGSVSTISHFLRGGRLPITAMWRVFEDICLYTAQEIPNVIRAVRAGKKMPAPTVEPRRISHDESIANMAFNAARRMEKAWLRIINDRRMGIV